MRFDTSGLHLPVFIWLEIDGDEKKQYLLAKGLSRCVAFFESRINVKLQDPDSNLDLQIGWSNGTGEEPDQNDSLAGEWHG